MKIINRWIERCISVLDLQLALTAISLPFIIGWGLPISVIAVIGNVIFGPFLTIFLLLASLIFVTQLLHVPNGLLIILLEWCNAAWTKILSFTSSAFLVSVPTAPSWCLAGIFIISCLILCCNINRRKRLFLYTTLLISTLLILKLYTLRNDKILHIKQGSKSLTIIKASDTIICIDPGIRATRNFKSWFFYTVLPEMRKQLGTTEITTYIALRPNRSTQELCRLLDMPANAHLIAPMNQFLYDFACQKNIKVQTVCAQKPLLLMAPNNHTITIQTIGDNQYCYATLETPCRKSIVLAYLKRHEKTQMQCS